LTEIYGATHYAAEAFSFAAFGIRLLTALTACRPSVTDFVFEFELHDE